MFTYEFEYMYSEGYPHARRLKIRAFTLAGAIRKMRKALAGRRHVIIHVRRKLWFTK